MTCPKFALVKPFQVISQHELNFIICCKRHHNKTTKKFRICKFKALNVYSKPQRFSKIIFKFNDELKLIAANLYHYTSFISGHEIKFKKSSNIVSKQVKETAILSLHIIFRDQ